MRKIVALIPPLTCEAVRAALVKVRIEGLVISGVKGCGQWFHWGGFVGILLVLIVMKVRGKGSPREFTTRGGAIISSLMLCGYAIGMRSTTAP